MITNEHQRELTRESLDRFEAAVRQHDEAGPRPDIHPRILRAMRDAAASEAVALRRNLQHYEDLLEGRVRHGPGGPAALVEARIASHISQRELADQLGVDEEQVEAWEGNDYDLVSAEQLSQVAEALGIGLDGPVSYLPPPPPPTELRSRVRRAGVPQDLSAKVEREVDQGDVAGVYARGFEWDIEDLISGVAVPAKPPLEEVVLKSKAGQAPRQSPLVRLAYTTGRIVVSMATRPPGPLPTVDPAQVRAEAIDEDGRVTLPSLLMWSWDRGLPVLPLVGAGGFAAAALRVDGRPVIVLKRKNAEMAYWLFDLAHELGHVALDHLGAAGLVDVSAPLSATRDAQENAANAWALELLLPDHARLIQRVSEGTRGDYMRFKRTVETLARDSNVSGGVLGLVSAFELPTIGEAKDRWGSATNIAKLEGTGRPLVEEALRSRISISQLSRIDRQLMSAVLFSRATTQT